MAARIKQNYPEAHVLGAMVEKMAAKGQEVIIGMRRDATFWPNAHVWDGWGVGGASERYQLQGSPTLRRGYR